MAGLFCRRAALLISLLCWLSRMAAAQSAPPSGGYHLRAVRVLRPLPVPPGGLIPYRDGKYWGYADSTGRVVIAPALGFVKSSLTALLVAGFAEISTASIPDKFLRRLMGKRGWKRYSNRAVFINARGELLLVRADEAAVLQPDGSLKRQKRKKVVGQTELHPPDGDWRGDRAHSGFEDFGPRRIVDFELIPSRTYMRVGLHSEGGAWLGEGRILLSNRMMGGSPRFRTAADTIEVVNTQSLRQLARHDNPCALAKVNGHRLTRHRFASIYDFAEGLAGAAVVTYQGPLSHPSKTETWGYLNQQGRWQIPPRFTEANAFRAGYAVVEVDGKYGYSGTGRYGVIDHAGHYTYPTRPLLLSNPDEAGFVRRQLADPTRAGRYRAQLLPPPGPAFTGDSVYDGAGAFRNGRAWVRQGLRQGLIDRQGRWITAPDYDLLLAPAILRTPPAQLAAEAEYESFWNQRPSVGYYEIPHTWGSYGAPRYPAPDTAYLLARRAGLFGFVARHSGREVVPCRYEQVLLNLYRGFACVSRQGTAYVINAQGAELVAGQYSGIDFQTTEGRLLHLRHPADSTWALMDTTGRLRTAWLPGNGYPVAGGWHLSREAGRYTVRDATGRLAYSSAYPIEQYALNEQWAGIAREQQAGLVAKVPFTPAWELHWQRPQPAGQVFFLIKEPLITRLLDIELKEIGQTATPPSLYSAFGFTPLGNGWHAVPVPGAKLLPTDGYQLLTDTGRLLPLLPPDNRWEVSAEVNYHRLYHQHGLLLTAHGYLTRGGRPLWKN